MRRLPPASSDETVGSYGGGIHISDTIKRPHLYGVACKYANVKMGMHFSAQDGTIKYVAAGSTAEEIGLTEGSKLLAINGTFIGADDFVVERELLSRNPGDTVKIEYLTGSGNKVTKDVLLRGF